MLTEVLECFDKRKTLCKCRIACQIVQGPGAEPGSEIIWNSRPMPLPIDLTPTISNCDIISLSYILKVKAVVFWADDLCATIDYIYLTRDWKPASLTPINRFTQHCNRYNEFPLHTVF